MRVPKFDGRILVGLMMIFFSAVTLAQDDGCEHLLTVGTLRAVREQLAVKAAPLFKIFSQVKLKICLENGFTIEGLAKCDFKGFLLVNPISLPKRMSIFISSAGTLQGSKAEKVEDWNIFDVRARDSKERGRTVDIAVHVGNWEEQSEMAVALQMLNILAAIHMIPYVHHLTLDIPIFGSNLGPERDVAFEELKELRNENVADVEILRALNLTGLELVTEYLPVHLVKVKVFTPQLDEISRWSEFVQHNYRAEVSFEIAHGH